MTLSIYLSGEIHTDWRDEIMQGCADAGLDVTFSAPVTDHAASDDCGVAILGAEPDKFWHDNKGARLNAIRTRTALAAADIVIDHGRCRDANDQGLSSTIIDFRDYTVVRAGCRFDEITAFLAERFGRRITA